MRKTNEMLLFNEVLKNLIFFQLPIKKVGFIMLILSKFQICGQLIVKYLNLWFTLLFYLENSVALKKDPTFGLTFEYKLKN